MHGPIRGALTCFPLIASRGKGRKISFVFDTGRAVTVRSVFPAEPHAMRRIVPLFVIVAPATNTRVAANNNRANARMTPTRRI